MAEQSYLSVNRYLRGGYGNGGDLTRTALRNTLQRATTTVNAFCNVPSQPSAYDFRGGTVVGEQHQWPYVAPLLVHAGARRIYLNQRPVQTVTSLVLQLAKNYTLTMNPTTDLVVNHIEGYAEIVALAPTVAGFFPIGWNFGLWTPIAIAGYTYGWSFDVVGDVLEAESPTLYTASHGNWVTTGVKVYVDGAEQTVVTDYSINADDGSILFVDASMPDIQSVVTADYTYTLHDAISQATGIIASDYIGDSRNAQRGLIGLQSLRVAEVAITQMSPGMKVSKNGVTIPQDAANLLGKFVMHSAA